MTEKLHTELAKLESGEPKIHALLCAITMGKREMERRGEGSKHWDEYADHIQEWEDIVSDAYFHDR